MIRLEFDYTLDDYREASKAHLRRGPGARKTASKLLGWLIFTIILIVLFMVVKSSKTTPSAVPGIPPPVQKKWNFIEFIVPLLPWIIVFVMIWTYILIRLRKRFQIAWDGQPWLQRRHTAEIDSTGVRIYDPVSRREDAWEAYSHLVETEHLFVLYLSNYAFHMIPKRAFPNAEEMQAFHQLAMNMITHRPKGAFPVTLRDVPPSSS